MWVAFHTRSGGPRSRRSPRAGGLDLIGSRGARRGGAGAPRLSARSPSRQAGYSLVEVMASIVILTAAIIPMMAMFDVGLRSAATSGDYDTARTLANKWLETAKGRPYDQARDSFPAGTPGPEGGEEVESVGRTDPELPGFDYTVAKRFVSLDGDRISNAPEDRGMLKVTVTVTWDGGAKSYRATGIISRGGVGYGGLGDGFGGAPEAGARGSGGAPAAGAVGGDGDADGND